MTIIDYVVLKMKSGKTFSQAGMSDGKSFSIGGDLTSANRDL